MARHDARGFRQKGNSSGLRAQPCHLSIDLVGFDESGKVPFRDMNRLDFCFPDESSIIYSSNINFRLIVKCIPRPAGILRPLVYETLSKY